VIKIYLPTKGARPEQRRVQAPRERAAAAAPGLIALTNHTQRDVDVLQERLGLLESLRGFLDEEMDEDVALGVLNVPASRSNKDDDETQHDTRTRSNMRPTHISLSILTHASVLLSPTHWSR